MNYIIWISLAKIPSGSQYDDAKRQWYSMIFNTLNGLSCMINEKMITDKKDNTTHETCYSNILWGHVLENASVDEKEGSNSYGEFKKLYLTIKKQ